MSIVVRLASECFTLVLSPECLGMCTNTHTLIGMLQCACINMLTLLLANKVHVCKAELKKNASSIGRVQTTVIKNKTAAYSFRSPGFPNQHFLLKAYRYLGAHISLEIRVPVQNSIALGYRAPLTSSKVQGFV